MTPTDRKIVGITPPAAIVNGASWTTASVDCLGFDYCTIYVYLGATDKALTALSVQESDNDSDYAAITGAAFATSKNSAGSTSSLPSATDDNKLFAFDIDLRGRKRYLDLVATIDTGCLGGYMAAWAELSRAETGPVTAAQRGVSQLLQVPAFG